MFIQEPFAVARIFTIPTFSYRSPYGVTIRCVKSFSLKKPFKVPDKDRRDFDMPAPSLRPLATSTNNSYYLFRIVEYLPLCDCKELALFMIPWVYNRKGNKDHFALLFISSTLKRPWTVAEKKR